MEKKANISELAVAAWRLEKWLDNLVADRKMAARSALRTIKKYLEACGIEIKDPLGSKFDPGLAVEVINNEEEDADDDDLIIIETLTPYIYQDGILIQHARVIIGTAVREAKPNHGESKTPEVCMEVHTSEEQPPETGPDGAAENTPEAEKEVPPEPAEEKAEETEGPAEGTDPEEPSPEELSTEDGKEPEKSPEEPEKTPSDDGDKVDITARDVERIMTYAKIL